MTTPYHYLNKAQQELVINRLAKKLKRSKVVIARIVTIINPEIKIVNNQVITLYETYKKIEREVKNYELSRKSEA